MPSLFNRPTVFSSFIQQKTLNEIGIDNYPKFILLCQELQRIRGVDLDELRNTPGALDQFIQYRDLFSHEQGKSLMHSDANPKNFQERFVFRAPPPGTGRVTFRLLIKQGETNKGALPLHYWLSMLP